MDLSDLFGEALGYGFDFCRSRRKKLRSKSKKYEVTKALHLEFDVDNEDYQQELIMSIVIEQSEWDEFLTEYGSGNTRRAPDGTRCPY